MLLVFTDLDGTLLNSDNYRYDAALPVLQRLQQWQVPVIPVTSKTRREVEQIRQAVAPHDPFVVENGSGIFIPLDDDRFPLSQAETWEAFQRVTLGMDYSTARQLLRQLEQRLQISLKGFGDLDSVQLRSLTGLSEQEAAQALAREFTEPFITPKTISADQIQQAAAELGVQITVGDRFSHLIGAGAGKGKAVQCLTQAYQAMHPDRSCITLGLGNSPNDRPMLEAVDIAIVIPGEKGIHPGLADAGWAVAPAPGAAGWAAAVSTFLEKFDDRLAIEETAP